MENQENETPAVEEVAEETEAKSEEQEPQLKTDEVIDVEWPTVEQLYRANEYSKHLESQLSDMCLRFEKTKRNLLTRIEECEAYLMQQGTAVRTNAGIDPSLTYELKLPKQEGEKAFFLRKDT